MAVRRTIALAALLATVVALTAACGSDGEDVASTGGPGATTSTTSAGAGAGVEGPEWVLDAADSSIDVPDGADVTLSVSDGQATGVAACNSYFGPFTVDGTELSVGPLASTERGCEPALMDAESAYTSALQAADTIEVGTDTLVITGPEESRLSFTALDREQALVGTWDVIQLATADAVTGVLDGTEPTIEFVDDGTLAASAGCNNGAGSWELDGDQLTIGPLASTNMACEEPVMQQETDLFAALEASKQVQVTGDSLTLLREDGTITVVATVAAGESQG